MSKDDDDPDGPRWAADEPTAMWDESAMADSGYQDLAKDRTEKPRNETGPATGREVKGDVAAKVAVSAELTGGHKAAPATPPSSPRSGALSWVITVVLAVALGGAAYFLVRLLR